MNNKSGRDRPRVSRALPHPSWNLDRPILFTSRDSATGEHRPGEQRTVTPEEIWALVDATS